MSRTIVTGCALLAALTVAACAETDAQDEGQPPEAALAESTSCAPAPDPVSVPDPSQVYVKKVTLAGAGCRPPGWTGTVTSSGSEFTFTFDDYRAAFDRAQTVPTLDCIMLIDLKHPERSHGRRGVAGVSRLCAGP